MGSSCFTKHSRVTHEHHHHYKAHPTPRAPSPPGPDPQHQPILVKPKVQGKCETTCPLRGQESCSPEHSREPLQPLASFVCAWQADDQGQHRGLLERVPESMPTGPYSCGHTACILHCPRAPGHLDGRVEMKAGEGATTASSNAFFLRGALAQGNVLIHDNNFQGDTLSVQNESSPTAEAYEVIARRFPCAKVPLRKSESVRHPCCCWCIA